MKRKLSPGLLPGGSRSLCRCKGKQAEDLYSNKTVQLYIKGPALVPVRKRGAERCFFRKLIKKLNGQTERMK